MPREPRSSDAAPAGAASEPPKPPTTESPSPSAADQPADQPSAVPLRDLLDAALHPDGAAAPDSGTAPAAGDSDSDSGAVDPQVPLSRAERRNKKRAGTPTTDRNYPSQPSTGRNSFARNPRRSPTRRQG